VVRDGNRAVVLRVRTAYRLTKNGSDNGVALFGWLIAMQLAALIPGLGFLLWKKYRDEDEFEKNSTKHRKPSRFDEAMPPGSGYDAF